MFLENSQVYCYHFLKESYVVRLSYSMTIRLSHCMIVVLSYSMTARLYDTLVAEFVEIAKLRKWHKMVENIG